MEPNIHLQYFSQRPVGFPYRVQNHIHQMWEIVYYKTGKGSSLLNGKNFQYQPNTYVIIPPRTAHAEEAYTDGNINICLGFETEEFKEDFLPASLFTDADERPILNLLNNIENEIKNSGLYYQNIIAFAVSEIFLLTKRSLKKKKTDTDARVSMIREYIDNYFMTDIDLNKLSENFFYSYDYLRHLFSEKMGITLKQYIIDKRINLAKLLLSSDLPIRDIAKKCGFCSPSHLSACFAATTGKKPSEYRKEQHFSLSSSSPYSIPVK